jgi:hypothetical protein
MYYMSFLFQTPRMRTLSLLVYHPLRFCSFLFSPLLRSCNCLNFTHCSLFCLHLAGEPTFLTIQSLHLFTSRSPVSFCLQLSAETFSRSLISRELGGLSQSVSSVATLSHNPDICASSTLASLPKGVERSLLH